MRPITLERFLEDELCPGEAQVTSAFARAGAQIAEHLRGYRGDASSPAHGYECNIHGEMPHPIDEFANDVCVAELARVPTCGGVLSEELKLALDFRSHAPESFVFFDPLDGSSNLDTHGPTGTIFGVVPWAGSKQASARQPGSELLLAGYLLYSSSTILVLATPMRALCFQWEPEASEFTLKAADLRCPTYGNTYSLNEGNVGRWDQPAQHWLSKLKAGSLFPGRKYTQRYAGALVADAHRTLLKGGVFAYPADRTAKNGKLRLQYEVNPMAFIFRAAGGTASTGSKDPLEITPENGHERCPLVLGSLEEVGSFEAELRNEAERRDAAYSAPAPASRPPVARALERSSRHSQPPP